MSDVITWYECITLLEVTVGVWCGIAFWYWYMIGKLRRSSAVRDHAMLRAIEYIVKSLKVILNDILKKGISLY